MGWSIYTLLAKKCLENRRKQRQKTPKFNSPGPCRTTPLVRRGPDTLSGPVRKSPKNRRSFSSLVAVLKLCLRVPGAIWKRLCIPIFHFPSSFWDKFFWKFDFSFFSKNLKNGTEKSISPVLGQNSKIGIHRFFAITYCIFPENLSSIGWKMAEFYSF